MNRYSQLIRGVRILEEFDVDGDDDVWIKDDELRSCSPVGVHGAERLLLLGWKFNEDVGEWVLKLPDKEAE
jgi:hypothetical protein